jgi:hypothetical protein
VFFSEGEGPNSVYAVYLCVCLFVSSTCNVVVY